MRQPYDIFIEPAVHAEAKRLRGHIRQRMKQTIKKLGHNPRPHNSQELDMTGFGVPAGIELRRLRIDKWRLIYAVSNSEKWVWVGAIRQRPPYDYEDLSELIQQLLGF